MSDEKKTSPDWAWDKGPAPKAVNVYGRYLRKDDPLIAGLYTAKDSDGSDNSPDDLIDVVVEFIRILLARIGTKK
jgi:hypothetical protein